MDFLLKIKKKFTEMRGSLRKAGKKGTEVYGKYGGKRRAKGSLRKSGGGSLQVVCGLSEAMGRMPVLPRRSIVF